MLHYKLASLQSISLNFFKYCLLLLHLFLGINLILPLQSQFELNRFRQIKLRIFYTLYPKLTDEVTEWLRCWTANPMCKSETLRTSNLEIRRLTHREVLKHSTIYWVIVPKKYSFFHSVVKLCQV